MDMEISTGSIVKFGGGYYRITRLTKKTVNLGSIFGRGIHHKGVDISLVTEAAAEWQEKWTQSDAYRCM